MRWRSTGGPEVPPELGSTPFVQRHLCVALIYEFLRVEHHEGGSRLVELAGEGSEIRKRTGIQIRFGGPQ